MHATTWTDSRLFCGYLYIHLTRHALLTLRQLKAASLSLLQAMRTFPDRPGSRKELLDSLSNLLETISSIASRPDALDGPLIEFVFVPISKVLQVSRAVPVRALEICLECISILLRAGWGRFLAPELSGQLLILFTFMAKPSSADSGIAGSTEELQTEAFKCMSDLFNEISRTTAGRKQLTTTANIPPLGEAVLVILDSLTDCDSNSVKIRALSALGALISAIDDKDALASFLPRMVSSLTKVLTPSSANRASFRVLQRGLESLSTLFLRLLSDQETRELPKSIPQSSQSAANKVIRSSSWLQATASQIKIALSNIVKLRTHDKPEVRQALLRLCLTVIQDCRTALADCAPMMIESMVTMVGRGGSQDTVERDLKSLLEADDRLSVLLKDSLYGWLVSLPRIMQSKDDSIRQRIIHQLSVTLRLLNGNQAIIDRLLAENLRDAVSAVLNDSKGTDSLVEKMSRVSLDQELVLSKATSTSFSPLQFPLKGQEIMMNEFGLLLGELSQSNSAITVAQNLIDAIEMGNEESRLASFWISVNLLRDMATYSPAIEEFIDIGSSNPQQELLDQLYSQSLTMLSEWDTERTPKWHSQALALEVVALQAARNKYEFRAELGDALYPVLHHLGSSHSGLQAHAIACLNIIADSCGYISASELIISNVDYIVNAVGLKLNYGDVSPQAPQVLLMAMRLCGPSLLPYLDDLVGSIFGALERYHGYPKLVELMFAVLKGMTEEGVKTPQLAITGAEDKVPENKNRDAVHKMMDIIEQVKKMEVESQILGKDDVGVPEGSFPRKPWKDLNGNENGAEDEAEDEEPSNEVAHSEDPPPPAPRTYEILLKISELTQHYLTSSSPSLRVSLLSLLHTTIPILAKHENSFLPLINTLWPVLLPRLEDPEAYIVSNTLDTVSLLCAHAGNFMRTRIEGAWKLFKAIHARTSKRKDSRTHMSRTKSATLTELSNIIDPGSQLSTKTDIGSSRLEVYVDSPTRMIWDALVRFLCSISEHMEMKDRYLDDILDMLEPVLARPEVKSALDSRNADAVWLRLYKLSKRTAEEKGIEYEVPAELGGPMKELPREKPEWVFVRL